jgi:hypothetical protein
VAKVSLELNLNDNGADEKVKSLVSSLQALSKTSTDVKGPTAGAAEGLAKQNDSLERLARNYRSSGAEATRFSQTLGGIGSTLQRTAVAATQGSGLAGPLGGAVGAVGIASLLVAVGGVIGMALKMAFEFEQSSARAAAALSIGFGGSLETNMKTLQSAAYKGQPYGYTANEMVSAMETYGRTAGANVNQTADAAPSMARYARAYGLDPTRLGGMVGSFQAASGGRGDFDSNAEALFGGAERAGSLGRRLDEFIGTSTSVLQTMMYGQSGSTFDPSRAAGFTSAIARNGGVYATAGGVEGVLGAGQALVGGGNSDIRKASLLLRAGVSTRDILLGNVGNDGQNMQKVSREVSREYGPVNSNGWLMGMLGAGVSQDQLRLLAGLPHPEDAFRHFDKAGKPTRLGQADEFAQTPAGMKDAMLAQVANSMTAFGETTLKGAADFLQTTKAIEMLSRAAATAGDALSKFNDWLNKSDDADNVVIDKIQKGAGGAWNSATGFISRAMQDVQGQPWVNNPLDLEGTNGKGESFSTLDEGIRAGAKRIGEYPKDWNAKTLEQLIPIWSGKEYPGGITHANYIKDVESWSGVARNESIADYTPTQLAGVVAAMSRVEGTSPVTEQQAMHALYGDSASVTAHGVKVNVTVRPHSKGPNNKPRAGTRPKQ